MSAYLLCLFALVLNSSYAANDYISFIDVDKNGSIKQRELTKNQFTNVVKLSLAQSQDLADREQIRARRKKWELKQIRVGMKVKTKVSLGDILSLGITPSFLIFFTKESR